MQMEIAFVMGLVDIGDGLAEERRHLLVKVTARKQVGIRRRQRAQFGRTNGAVGGWRFYFDDERRHQEQQSMVGVYHHLLWWQTILACEQDVDQRRFQSFQ